MREVRWLQRRDRKAYLAFEDISSPNFDARLYGLTQQDVMAQIHGVLPDGRVVRRVEVFRQAYRAVGLGWLLAPTAWPVFRWVFDVAYGVFARYRLPLGRVFGRRCSSGTCQIAPTAKN